MSAGMQLSVLPCGAPKRPCVAILQRASTESPHRGAYLLCRPLAQEATRTAAMYRVLSERLARQGCDVLRLDYHGCGDSPGEEQHQAMGGWAEDILAAHEALRSHARGPIRWFGMGLGANLALRASARVVVPPDHLVLWEPVLDGPSYAQALFQGHRSELAREFGYSWPKLLRQGRVHEPTLPGDVLGFAVGATLAADLLRIRALPLAQPLRRGISVSCAVHAEQRSSLPALDHERFHWHTVEHRTDWMSSQALGTAIVPPDALRLLLDTLA